MSFPKKFQLKKGHRWINDTIVWPTIKKDDGQSVMGIFLRKDVKSVMGIFSRKDDANCPLSSLYFLILTNISRAVLGRTPAEIEA